MIEAEIGLFHTSPSANTTYVVQVLPTILGGTDNQGEMAIVNSSRGILYASNSEDFADVARSEAIRLKDAMNDLREQKKEKNK